MKVIIQYHIHITRPSLPHERGTWETEISNDEFQHFMACKSSHRWEFQEIREEYPGSDEDFENNPSAQEEICALNFEILRETLPHWCKNAQSHLYDDLLKQHPALSVSDLDIDGCLFE